MQVFSRGRGGSDPPGTHRSRKTWVLLGEGQSREEVKILRGQWIPEGKTQSLGLLLSGGADLKALGLKKNKNKGLRISGATSPRDLCPGRDPLQGDILIAEMEIRWTLGHLLGPPSLSASLWDCLPSSPPTPTTSLPHPPPPLNLASRLTFHMARIRNVSSSRPPSTPTSTHHTGISLSSKTRSTCVCT